MEECDGTRDVRQHVDCDRRFQGEQEPQRGLDVRAKYDKTSKNEGENGEYHERVEQHSRGKLRLASSEPYGRDRGDVRAHPGEGDRFLGIMNR